MDRDAARTALDLETARVLSDHNYSPAAIKNPDGLVRICGCGYATSANHPWFPDWLDHAAPLVTDALLVARQDVPCDCAEGALPCTERCSVPGPLLIDVMMGTDEIRDALQELVDNLASHIIGTDTHALEISARRVLRESVSRRTRM